MITRIAGEASNPLTEAYKLALMDSIKSQAERSSNSRRLRD